MDGAAQNALPCSIVALNHDRGVIGLGGFARDLEHPADGWILGDDSSEIGLPFDGSMVSRTRTRTDRISDARCHVEECRSQ